MSTPQPHGNHHRDLYIAGKWEPSLGTASIDVLSASTEEVIGSVPEGTPAGRRSRGPRRPRRIRRWMEPDHGRGTSRVADETRGRSQRTHRPNRERHCAGSWIAPLDGDSDPGRPARRRYEQLRAVDRDAEAGAGDRQLTRRARAIRSRRRNHALELSAASDHGEDRAGAGRRVHGRVEAPAKSRR
jgi:hypothetical protein